MYIFVLIHQICLKTLTCTQRQYVPFQLKLILNLIIVTRAQWRVVELVMGGFVINKATPSSSYKVGCDIYLKDAMKDGLVKKTLELQSRPGGLVILILGDGTSAHKSCCS